mgnify:CR=1 FL=1
MAGSRKPGVTAIGSSTKREWPRRQGARSDGRYGLTGARGEARSGFASVREIGLPSYHSARRQGADEDRALLAAMVALLAVNKDTNLIARGGPEGAAFVRQLAHGLLTDGPMTPDFVDRLEAMDDALTARNLSPGGTADLVGVTWFLAQVDAGSKGHRES